MKSEAMPHTSHQWPLITGGPGYNLIAETPHVDIITWKQEHFNDSAESKENQL